MKKNTATIILTTVLSISIVTNGCAATASFPGEDAACNPTASTPSTWLSVRTMQ